ncbi:methyl-accepting chemotaxis protein [Hahella ganghwensis]|uniref:methyl-accepting chemotaxis protein n=1 Tax=Hahella ganghwensis TaxID=286420 RepID=UPI00037831EB|nr:methyl-accepting chemotaxis protein [Hahella ganghwensis]
MTVKRSLVLVGSLFVVILLVILVSLFSQTRLVHENELQMENSVQQLRYVGDLDMRHDGVRGSIYQYLLSLEINDSQMQSEAREVFAEHKGRMLEDLTRISGIVFSEKLTTMVQEVEPDMRAFLRSAEMIINSRNYAEAASNFQTFQQSFDNLEVSLEALEDGVLSAYKDISNRVEASLDTEMFTVVAVTSIGIILGVGALYGFGRKLMKTLGAEPAALSLITDELAKGNYDQDLEGGGGVFASMRELRDQLKAQVERDRAQMVEMTRLKQAIETTTSSIMVADEEFNIVYMNPAVTKTLSDAEHEIRKRVPQFDADKLIGQNIDFFHKNPAHQRQLLKSLRGPYEANLALGDTLFDLTAGAIRDDKDEILGYVVEWRNVTQERLSEVEMTRLKQAIETTTSSIMVADEQFNIVYMNPAVTKTLSDAEDEIRKQVPQFDADKLIGQNIDFFHKNPAHQRQLLKSLTGPYDANLALGDTLFDLTAGAIRDGNGEILGYVVEWRNVTQERQAEVEMTRLQQAIETTSTALMVADEHYNIVYMNPSVTRVLKAAESEIRKRLPQFNADELLGQNIDFFHKNPAHQRQLLSQLKAPHEASLVLGGSHFDLTAGTIRDSKGKILGFVVEWRDVTNQVNAESEVEKLVLAAKQGDLKERVPAEGKEGFFLKLAEGLNEFVQVVDNVLEDIDSVVSKMAKGDLSGRMNTDYNGQYANIADSVNGSVERLNGIVNQLLVATESVRAANHEISTGNNQLSERTEKQSSSLEETASSMEELASNVRNTADNSRQADQLSNHSRDSASKGGEVIKRTVSSMAEINESSRKIAEIISVIDDIAFQTNLLALNASVEAARAGEQGRGFAVVATEVRNLAQRSATSAKEIKELIEDSVKKVQAGSELVNESGSTLDDIIANVKKVSDLISDIAAATEEQSSGIDQINRAISELDEITQQNAALAEETASSAESSLDSVAQMVQVMSFFQAKDELSITLPQKTQPRKMAAPAATSSKGNNKDKSAAPPPKTSKPEADEDDWEVF